MDLNARMEKFSIAYIEAVAAQSDVKVGRWNHDSHSVDGTLRWEDGQRPMIDFQAKCSSQHLISGDLVRFPLRKKNYDELRPVNLPAPIFLIVVLVPVNPDLWLRFSDEEICSQSRGFFHSLEGDPPLDEGRQQKTVEIPRQNVFDRSHLLALMQRADRREP